MAGRGCGGGGGGGGGGNGGGAPDAVVIDTGAGAVFASGQAVLVRVAVNVGGQSVDVPLAVGMP